MTSPPTPIQPAQFGVFELRQQLTQASSGSLYRAYNTLLHKEVIIKLMPAASLKSPDLLKRFQREMRLAGQLHHPNLTSVIHADFQDGVYYLILENIDGIDFVNKVRREGPLPIDKAVHYIIQAAQGLGYLHEKGVIHRNMKPANMMLDSSGVIRILNLTTAHLEADASVNAGDAEQLTRMGQIVGTAEFLAPEQAFDSRVADARSDIYSLGCTLFYLIAGKVPFESDGKQRTITAHIQQPIPSLRAARPEVSPQIDAVFQKMLAKMPIDRYASMTEVINDLERALKGLAPVNTNAASGNNSMILQIIITILAAVIGALVLYIVQKL